MDNNSYSNPAVVGLAGFGMTTLTLQFHNLGWCGIGPVIWLGLIFGGSAQLFAGLMEFRKNNNFGFCAFTAYGAFWISLCLMLIFGKNPQLAEQYPVFAFTVKDLGFYLLVWGLFTAILFIASLKHTATLALIFFTLTLGFAGLIVKEFTGSHIAGTFAAYDLILCALLAWYNMAAVIYAEAGINLPLGAPLWGDNTDEETTLPEGLCTE